MKRRYGLLVIIKWNNISPAKHSKLSRKLYGRQMLLDYFFISLAKHSKLSRKLYGGMCFSNYCKYSYPSEGILGEIPYIKVAGSVFIIREGFEEKIKELFSGTSSPGGPGGLRGPGVRSCDLNSDYVN